MCHLQRKKKRKKERRRLFLVILTISRRKRYRPLSLVAGTDVSRTKQTQIRSKGRKKEEVIEREMIYYNGLDIFRVVAVYSKIRKVSPSCLQAAAHVRSPYRIDLFYSLCSNISVTFSTAYC